ncbi:MAG: tripartite tricarboxylate transporter TctB family protein [Roseibium sp.]|uniref:tripartite tricarboxylate transporter TctB family protein n=1 Tax=Roseibium sp. TaxID=1936156 RepID=UPI0026291A44|nr:tripartite tricarboxylate transporter TctB family protein [Roseibium sp.]MCV0426926.1 tripartite tricarboxylate transporter TctB family protein [Roseibium sp.]
MRLPKDLVSGSVILVLCAALFHITTTFDSDPLGAAQGMPATHMPRLVLTVIALLTVIMIVQGLRSDDRKVVENPPWKMWGTAGLLSLTAISLPIVGVPLSFFAVCIALPLLWGARDLKVIGIFAVAVPVAIYVLFQLLLGLRLPLGPLAMLS